MSKENFVIAWNESRTEGVVFRNQMGDDGENDARHATGIRRTNPCATLADAFLETYGEDQSCLIQEVQIDTSKAKPAEEW